MESIDPISGAAQMNAFTSCFAWLRQTRQARERERAGITIRAAEKVTVEPGSWAGVGRVTSHALEWLFREDRIQYAVGQ
jgi:hypothetical protein